MMRYMGRNVTWSRACADVVFDEALDPRRTYGFGRRSPLDRQTGAWLGFASRNRMDRLQPANVASARLAEALGLRFEPATAGLYGGQLHIYTAARPGRHS